MKGAKYARVPPEMPRGKTMPNMTWQKGKRGANLRTPEAPAGKNLTYVKSKRMTKEGSNGRLYTGHKVAGGWQNNQ